MKKKSHFSLMQVKTGLGEAMDGLGNELDEIKEYKGGANGEGGNAEE